MLLWEGRRKTIEEAPGSGICQRLETDMALVRLVCALMVAMMSFIFTPTSRPLALLIAFSGAAYSHWCLLSIRGLPGTGRAEMKARTSLAVDGVLAAATYALFMRDPRATPVAFVPLLVFELAARFASYGLLAAALVMAAALGARIYAQALVLEGGTVRPAMVLVWLGVGVMMAAFGREFRAQQRHCLSMLRERARIADSFRATVEQVLARYGVQPGSATLSQVEHALGEICGQPSPERERHTARIAELIVTARDDLGLTRREQEIAGLLARGNSCARIAAELHVSQSTVRNHIHHIKGKLGLGTRDELITRLRGAGAAQSSAGLGKRVIR